MNTRTAPTRFLLITMAGLAAIAALALIAPHGGAAQSARAGKVVGVRTVGKAKVFVNAQGKTLYSPVQEKSGTVLCVGSCTSVWKPVKTTLGASQLTAIHAGLGTVKRPDGSKQVAFHKHPLYSFAIEGPGALTGDGVKDAFGTTHFTWRAAKVGGGSNSGTPTPPYPGGY